MALPSPGPDGPQSGLDHVAWVVRDLAAAAWFFGPALGGTVIAGGDETELNVRSLHVSYPRGGKVELLSPTGPGLHASFLDRYGDRVHHVTFVHDGIAGLAARLQAGGYRVAGLDTTGKAWEELFVSPASAHGCVVQVVNRMDHYGPRVPGLTVESVLAGQWRWLDGVPVRQDG
jgi:catechol 2,3-dioxygenase-like lactoylglutathione lyase family enzyme